LISHAGTGWRTQGTGFGYSAGVKGRQFCNDFNVSWNVFWAVTGYNAGKSSNAFPAPYPQFAKQKPSPRRSQLEHRRTTPIATTKMAAEAATSSPVTMI
jgi:hypothetical protein